MAETVKELNRTVLDRMLPVAEGTHSIIMTHQQDEALMRIRSFAPVAGDAILILPSDARVEGALFTRSRSSQI